MQRSIADVTQILVPPTRDLGEGFQVRRALPAAQQRMVGPFIFFDQMGPARFDPGRGLDVRPHPHIGLATVTYLFEGEILHRDSLGVVQPIRPGEVNWMIAGRGIAHSERSSPEARTAGGALSGIQVWLALPQRDEEIAPAFTHHAAEELPQFDEDGAQVRLIAGSLYGESAPARVFSPMFYADAALPPGARASVPAEYEQRAIYVAQGSIELNHARIDTGRMLVLEAGKSVSITALAPARVLLLGGAPMDGDRHIWWNFVSSSRERIEQAKEDWKAGRFAPVPGETEFIPAPEDGPALVRYP